MQYPKSRLREPVETTESIQTNTNRTVGAIVSNPPRKVNSSSESKIKSSALRRAADVPHINSAYENFICRNR